MASKNRMALKLYIASERFCESGHFNMAILLLQTARDSDIISVDDYLQEMQVIEERRKEHESNNQR
jgi:hypothetical protein